MTMTAETVLETSLPGIRPFKKGKVRDVYDLGEHLLIVATDRISAFDVVIPTGIPDKQQLVLLEKTANGKLITKDILPVRFSELEEGGDVVGAA